MTLKRILIMERERSYSQPYIPCAAGQALAEVDEEHGCEEAEGNAEGRDSLVRVWQQPC